MAGDDRVRFCGQCHLNVYNLSAMSAQEGRSLVVEREGRLCVRFYQRHDGTVLTKDCPVGLRIVMRRLARAAAIAFSALLNVLPAVGCARPLQGQIVQEESSLDLLVVDSQGAVCPGATVEILRDGQPVGSVLSTNNEGEVHLRHLAPGQYTVKISYPNFKSYEKIVTLKSGVRSKVNATLELAALQGEVVMVRPEPMQVIQSPTSLLEPVPVPGSEQNRH